LSVRTFGRLFTEEEFNNLIITVRDGANIVLRDVGEAVLGPENEESILKESAVPMIALAITPQPGSNYVAIADEFYRRYEALKKTYPMISG
jgi:Cation/multidrug efflux pump